MHDLSVQVKTRCHLWLEVQAALETFLLLKYFSTLFGSVYLFVFFPLQYSHLTCVLKIDSNFKCFHALITSALMCWMYGKRDWNYFLPTTCMSLWTVPTVCPFLRPVLCTWCILMVQQYALSDCHVQCAHSVAGCKRFVCGWLMLFFFLKNKDFIICVHKSQSSSQTHVMHWKDPFSQWGTFTRLQNLVNMFIAHKSADKVQTLLPI